MVTVTTSNIEGTDLFKIFSSKNMYIKQKAKTGYRIYKNDRKFRFFDWFPGSGSISRFDGKWRPVNFKSQDPIQIADYLKRAHQL